MKKLLQINFANKFNILFLSMRIKVVLIFTFLQVVFFSFSQVGNNVSGKIIDEKSAPVSKVSIRILNTNYKAISDENGLFFINAVALGEYIIVAEAIGFSTLNEKITVTKEWNQTILMKLAKNISQLEDVVVTAQKQEEVLKNVPLSVSVLSAKNISDYRLWNNKDLTAIVPTLYVSNPGDGRDITSIRGITSTSYDPAITTYIDGVSQFTLDSYIPQLFDVERIEVLRGPQGTLYGRNSMGGVINIITKQPTNKQEAFAEMSFGNYGLTRINAGFRIPIIPKKLYVGFAGLYEGSDGFFTNKFNNSKFDTRSSIGSNFYLKYLPTNKLTVAMNVKQMANRNMGAFPLAGNANAAFANPYVLNQNAVTKMIDNILNSSISINYSAKHVNLSSQTAYQTNYRYYDAPIDGDFSPLDGVSIIKNYGKEWNKVSVLTQELKLTSIPSLSPLNWIAGVYLFYQESPNKQATHFGKDAAIFGSPSTNYKIINTTTEKNKGIAFYTQFNYTINKKLKLMGGLRYDYQHTYNQVLGEYQPDASPVPIYQTRSDTSAQLDYHTLLPKISLSFYPSNNQQLYISYSRGYHTGGFSDLSLNPTQPPLYPYQPELSDNYEIGLKGNLLKNQLMTNLTLFYSRITDVQVPTLVLPDAITITKNAGLLNSIGFEVELSAFLLKGLEAFYSFGYTHAIYETLKLSSNGTAKELSGKRQIYTPETTSMLSLEYSLYLNNLKSAKLFVRSDWKYLGNTFFDLKNSIQQPSYHLLNASMGMKIKQYECRIWANNLTDTRYISYAYDFGAVHLGNPQIYGVSLKASF